MSFLFGSSGKAAKTRDLTPTEFTGLRAPLSSELLGLLSSGPAGFGGSFNAPINPTEAAALEAIRAGSAPSGTQTAASGAVTANAGGLLNPFAGAAGITAPELFGLSQIGQQGFAGIDPFSQAVLSSILAGGAGNLSGLTTAGTQGAFSPITALNLLSPIAAGAPNPFLPGAIEAAQRPILEDFEQSVLRNRGLFTQAGQTIQGEGSSPFQQALARAQTGTARALGDVATNLAFQTAEADAQRRLQAAQVLGGLEVSGRAQGLEAIQLALQGGQLGLQGLLAQGGFANDAFSRALQATQALGLPREIADVDLSRRAGAFEDAAQRSLTAAQTAPALEQVQFDKLLSNLEAQALPRLIEELGIERGLAEFERQQGQLVQLLTLVGQLSSPTVAQTPGKTGSTGLLGGILTGAATAFGGPFGSAAAKALLG